jgi:hypothetical protein
LYYRLPRYLRGDEHSDRAILSHLLDREILIQTYI